MCFGPFVLGNVDAWATNKTHPWVNEKSCSSLDKALLSIDEGLRRKGIFHSPTALFSIKRVIAYSNNRHKL